MFILEATKLKTLNLRIQIFKPTKTNIMNKSKILRFTGVLFTLFLLSAIYTIIDGYSSFNSAYDLGFATGLFFGNLLKILGVLALVVLAFRYFKED